MKTTALKAILVFAVLFVSAMIFAQSTLLTVTGTVTDADDKSPIPGVSVIEKGTANATVTDANGHFSIRVEKGKTLVFSYLGYISKEVKAKNASLNVTLEQDEFEADEIVT